jgi:CTP synthase (UTP-ammonia lyase)
VLQIEDAEHAESAPGAARLVVSKLVCSLVGTVETVRLLPGTLARMAYGADEALEQFACNYGLNPDYREQLFQGELKAAGFGPQGEVRLLELPARPFFAATLFLPQMRSSPDQPHPLILAFVRAARETQGHLGPLVS